MSKKQAARKLVKDSPSSAIDKLRTQMAQGKPLATKVAEEKRQRAMALLMRVKRR